MRAGARGWADVTGGQTWAVGRQARVAGQIDMGRCDRRANMGSGQAGAVNAAHSQLEKKRSGKPETLDLLFSSSYCNLQPQDPNLSLFFTYISSSNHVLCFADLNADLLVMRIRKQASKLLGWASCYPFPSSSSTPLSLSERDIWSPGPPPPSHLQLLEAYAGEFQCQLNLSPWDAIESSQCTNSQEAEMEATNEEQMSGFENGFGDKDGEEKEETEEKMEEKKGQGRKRREKEMESSGSGAMIKCKKTDGKGWHCKRLAQSPHSLCSYHLTQLRSYRTRFDDQVSGDHRKKYAFSVDSGGSASNYYYYYSILGPWWGKRRGPVTESSEGNEENGISSKDCNVKSADSEAAVDVNAVEEEEEDDDEDYGESFGNVTYLQKKKKTKRMIKRKGRKPVKARSLKSLL
ncbi:hypothetical protein KFK09_009969 [Dendrobium nobile]|uniref:WRC domain-containing protein n=1 Tax=Dendrobium nobile TaxID=94219 RepID=A0A8T3BIJ7_DENNO|nr:hypothetical protein KFK09_009969 [Dendrobium nobile]